MRLEYGFCIVFLLFSSFLRAQEEHDNGALARVEGVGARDGLSLLLLNLEKESRLQWRAVNVERSDVSMGVLLARVNQWPIESVTTATVALICDRNPHACCPYSPSSTLRRRKNCLRELRSNTSGSPSPKILEDKKYCKAALDRYITGRSATICASHWEPIPVPDTAKTTEACGPLGGASPWSVCLPIITIRSEIGIQDFPFNPKKENLREKFELVKGCSELPTKSEITKCRSAFSEKNLNSLNFGNYQARVQHDGKITLPTQSFFIDIPSIDSKKNNAALKKGLQNTAEAMKIRGMTQLQFDWIENIKRGPTKTQQSETTLRAKTLPTKKALEIMGFDSSMQPITHLAPIISMDPNPLTDSNPRLQTPFINAFNGKEISNAAKQQLGCAWKTITAYKPLEWFSLYSNEDIGHAAEVIGVMAAQPVEGSPVFGVLAKYGELAKAAKHSQVYAYYIDDGDGRRDTYNLVNQIFTYLPVKNFRNTFCADIFPIVNVSLRFSNEGAPPPTLEGEHVLIGRASQPGSGLYVVAAGNPDTLVYNTRRKQQTCNHKPGCEAYKTQNMISVVGLDITGESPSTSSLAGAPFEVAAVGDVQTISYKGDDINAYGSSFATPFVTSLASLILGKARMLSSEILQPPDLKVRILQTVDFLYDLSIVQFGRINYSRAIEIDRDIIVLNSSLKNMDFISAPYCQDNSNCYIGAVNKDVRIKNVEGYDPLTSKVIFEKLDFNKILRLHRASSSTWSLIYMDEGKNSVHARVLHEVEFDGLESLKFSQGAGEQSIPLSIVQDYTRCMWRKGYDGECLGGTQ